MMLQKSRISVRNISIMKISSSGFGKIKLEHINKIVEILH